MRTVQYLLGTGYFNRSPESDTFIETWCENTARANPSPVRTVVISVGNSWRREFNSLFDWDVVSLEQNCGHLHALIGKEEPRKPHVLCGWSASVLALAMIAYNAESDF